MDSDKIVQVIFASYSMLSDLTGKEEIVLCSDGAYKLDSNGYQLMLIGVAGK